MDGWMDETIFLMNNHPSLHKLIHQEYGPSIHHPSYSYTIASGGLIDPSKYALIHHQEYGLTHPSPVHPYTIVSIHLSIYPHKSGIWSHPSPCIHLPMHPLPNEEYGLIHPSIHPFMRISSHPCIEAK